LQNTVSLKISKNLLEGFDWDSFIPKLGNELTIEKVSVKSPYELARFSAIGVAIVVYSSGKVVLQGGNVTDDFVCKVEGVFGIKKKKSINKSVFKGYIDHIGVDEVGKGDFFGPMVVCAAFLTAEMAEEFKKTEMQDSKKLSDSIMCDMYDDFAGKVPHVVSIVTPEIYNREYPKVKNVSILLAQNHAKCIEDLLTELDKQDIKCEKVVIDQFSKKKDRVTSLLGKRSKEIKFEQFHKGESDIAVAVASVFARAVFVKAWKEMDETYGFKFPKGATHVIEPGKQFVKLYGGDRLAEVAKMSFRTAKQVQSKSGR
jgi:ribonuclease HIII